ncbi:MAG: hypothetical protein A2X36_00160 [Elusimicrobia bacterium GWA2_69_24]|nr:MAG: hypothetical protein A2X36_00160 [Elusimicrobia bacterium GWA2_69_24]HBL17278.1 response regulator receiver protein [Elusimicrobiota bacterium]
MGFFGSNRKRKVLLIDDEVSTRTMMAMFFEELGFAVAEASSGDHGIQVADDESPDIILLDIMMPGLSGFDTLRYFRGNPKTQATPIIMVTARDLVEDVEHCLEGGANDFIQKPFDLQTLRSKVEKFLPRK